LNLWNQEARDKRQEERGKSQESRIKNQESRGKIKNISVLVAKKK